MESCIWSWSYLVRASPHSKLTRPPGRLPAQLAIRSGARREGRLRRAHGVGFGRFEPKCAKLLLVGPTVTQPMELFSVKLLLVSPGLP
jgi:hypothetical protein